MAFYKALGGGQVAKKGLLALASKEVRQNNTRSKNYIAAHGLDSNLSGEGMILGGLLVLRADEGGIVMQKNESTFGAPCYLRHHAPPRYSLTAGGLTCRGVPGDIAAIEEVIAAARVAAYRGEAAAAAAEPGCETR